MVEDSCGLIADYENRKNIPPEDRCTEYQPEFGFYVLKMDISKGKFNERLAEAREAAKGQYAPDGKKMKAFVRVQLGQSNVFSEAETYPLSEEEAILQSFTGRDSIDKKLGIMIGDIQYYLIRKHENEPYEMMGLPFGEDARILERLDDMRSHWYKKLLEMERAATNYKMQELILMGEQTSPKQKFNYVKEIERRMKNCRKYFVEERMEGYDFRYTDLSGAIFMLCSLNNSNFAGVNLEGAMFVNCEMNGITSVFNN